MKKVSQKGHRLQGIYRIVHIASGRVYIGRTVDYASRQRAHIWHLERGKHQNSKLQRAWDKHGAEAFLFEFLEEVERDEDLIPREQVYLDGLRPFYNVALDAANPVRFSGHSETFRDALRNGERPCCPQGHMYEGDNIIWHGPDKTKKRCRACHNAQVNARYHQRLAEAGKVAATYARDRTHCPQGHAYAVHGGVSASGWRWCKQCNRDRASVRYHKQREAAGHAVAVRARDRTHCPHGHEYSTANTRIDKDGWRTCRACQRGKYAATVAAKKAAGTYKPPGWNWQDPAARRARQKAEEER